MLVKLTASIPNEIPLEGIQMGINYGFEKVRFINPVLSGKRIRASAVTSAVELKGTAVNSTRTITVEIEGEGKPALVADWIGRTVYDSEDAMNDYPIVAGSALFTLVDPSKGHEVAYNRWYERDHFYAGCMIGPWLFAGKRWVATRR